MKGRYRRFVRLINVLFFDGFRIAPGWMALVTTMLVLGSIASTCYPLGYRLLVDGANSHSGKNVILGIILVSGLMSIGWVLNAIGASEAIALSDRISTYRTAQIVRLVSGVSGIEHLERPEFLSEVEQLNANRRQLAAAPRLILQNTASVARIVTLLVLMASVSPWLLLLPICTAAPFISDRIVKRIAKQADDAMSHKRRLADKIFALITEAAAAAEVRAYGLLSPLKNEHQRLYNMLNRQSYLEAAKILVVQISGWFLYAAGLMGAIAFVVIRSAEGAISLGTLLMVVSLIRRSRNQLASMARSSSSMVSTLATVERLFWLEDFSVEQAKHYGNKPLPTFLSQGIQVKNLSFHYPGTDRTVLGDLNLCLPAGKTVALIGENGSGKTTLAKLLLGMYQPDKGQILIDGIPLDDFNLQSWRNRSTAAFQDFSRLHLPAVESIGVADLPNLDDEPAAIAALERAGGAALVQQLPNGLSTYVGSSYTAGHNLSGGQWQKLALGRAMRRETPLLVVLDEPTASLDAQAEHALFERYAHASLPNARQTGAITVLVTHRFSSVGMVDLIVFLEEGKAVEVGSHDELLRQEGRYAELFKMQAAGYR